MTAQEAIPALHSRCNPILPLKLSNLWTDLMNSRLRFEDDIYGPLNAILNIVFPPSHDFIVHPQKSLRRVYLGTEDDHANLAETSMEANTSLQSNDSSSSRVSYDTYSRAVVQPSHSGPERRLFPDFVVTKTVDGTIGGSFTVAIIEVKRYGSEGGEDEVQDADAQLREYMMIAQEHVNLHREREYGREIEGVLLFRGDFLKFSMSDFSPTARIIEHVDYFDASDPGGLISHLVGIARSWA
ncbi:hypothetical protein BT69DRAFT_1286526 [Atractiella rhizophila]|nr:hypothetical protein BT69DRAFT_1286526 [Atractiella rhizophila]